jgi:GNAT superfamily N-acetyltransferase
MERIPDQLLQEADRIAIERACDAAFHDFALQRTTVWAPPELWFVERGADGLDGFVGLLWREVIADTTPVRVGGIASLVVDPDRRGTGLGARLLDRALAEMRATPMVAAGLLLCAEKLVPFYARLGWQRVTTQVRCMQHGVEIDWPAAAMQRPLVAAGAAASATLRLNGLPW